MLYHATCQTADQHVCHGFGSSVAEATLKARQTAAEHKRLLARLQAPQQELQKTLEHKLAGSPWTIYSIECLLGPTTLQLTLSDGQHQIVREFIGPRSLHTFCEQDQPFIAEEKT